MGNRLRTVLVVGAGASSEAGFVTGTKFKTQIAAHLSFTIDHFGHLQGGDNWISAELRRRHGDDLNKFANACKTTSNGVVLSPSIDDFVDAHRDNQQIAICAKLAIARTIAAAEHDSKLCVRSGNIYNTVEFTGLEKTWYPSFFQWVSRRCPRSERRKLFDDVKVVCFNYDRCIEHFLTHAIATYYDVDIAEGRELASTLEIHHPYGTIGPYFGDQPVAFGTEEPPKYDLVLSTLKTYSEQVEDGESQRAIRSAVAGADVLIFLGMAFHLNNMAVLSGGGASSGAKRTYFTRLGISEESLPNVHARLAPLRTGIAHPFEKPYFCYAGTCREIWDMYHLALSEIRE